jgi:hypothetical protein
MEHAFGHSLLVEFDEAMTKLTEGSQRVHAIKARIEQELRRVKADSEPPTPATADTEPPK